jgi:hypothetical protein
MTGWRVNADRRTKREGSTKIPVAARQKKLFIFFHNNYFLTDYS